MHLFKQRTSWQWESKHKNELDFKPIAMNKYQLPPASFGRIVVKRFWNSWVKWRMELTVCQQRQCWQNITSTFYNNLSAYNIINWLQLFSETIENGMLEVIKMLPLILYSFFMERKTAQLAKPTHYEFCLRNKQYNYQLRLLQSLVDSSRAFKIFPQIVKLIGL